MNDHSFHLLHDNTGSTCISDVVSIPGMPEVSEAGVAICQGDALRPVVAEPTVLIGG